MSAKIIPYEDSIIKDLLKPRKPDTSKGDYGHVLSVCGSRGMAGAAFMCATAALYTGAGLVTAAVPDAIETALACRFTEIMTFPLVSSPFGGFSSSCVDALLRRASRANVVVIGCGLSINEETESVVGELLTNLTIPVVLDADGLNIASRNIHLLERRACGELVMTPHTGEMSRLTGIDYKKISDDREGIATDFAAQYGVTLVLKGHRTITAGPNGKAFINTTGNAGMAKGGSGDTLAGIIAGLIAQGIPPFEAAAAGVYLHGLAGDAAAKNISQRGMTASDLLKELRILLRKFD